MKNRLPSGNAVAVSVKLKLPVNRRSADNNKLTVTTTDESSFGSGVDFVRGKLTAHFGTADANELTG